MKWYKYGESTDGRILVLCKPDDLTVISGFADSIPEYAEWLAEGNIPEPWNPTPAPEEVTPEGE